MSRYRFYGRENGGRLPLVVGKIFRVVVFGFRKGGGRYMGVVRCSCRMGGVRVSRRTRVACRMVDL
jgi:hypothetical protein